MQELIKVENLYKRYSRPGSGGLEGVTLVVYPGEALAIFGLSGSGKSTLIRILAGVERPDSGAVRSAGYRFGFCLAEPVEDKLLTPYEVLWLYATLYEIPRRKRHSAIRGVLRLVDLDAVRDRRTTTFSYSMRKRLEVARAVLSPSDLILMDEPTSGLDSEMRCRLWRHLLGLRANEDKTIVIATSRPEDAELCDRIVLLYEGKVLACGTLNQLRGLAGPETMVIKPVDQKKKASGSGHRPPKVEITAVEQEGALVVEMGATSRPVEIVRQISGEVSAVRLKPRGLGSILEEIVARRGH